jgi:NitT/TauT family transport system substrate-binding protein
VAARAKQQISAKDQLVEEKMANMRALRSLLKAFVLLGAVAGIVAGPGGALAQQKELTKIVFQLNFAPGGYHAGFPLALERGYYKDAGLDVTIEPGNGSQITAQLVAAGKADIAYADAAPVMKLISSGAKMKILATIFQGNPNQVTALKKTGLKSVADLKGRSIGMPTSGSQPSMFPLVMAANGLKDGDVKIVNMPGDSLVAALMQGTVDTIAGSVDSYGLTLKSLGAETTNFLFIDNGAPTVSTSIIASDSILAQKPDVVKAFVAASLKGWYAAIDDPDAAVKALKKFFPDANLKLAPEQIEATKYLMCVNRAKFVGKATPEQWEDTVRIFSKIDILPATIPASAYYTYDFLPPESELRKCPL